LALALDLVVVEEEEEEEEDLVVFRLLFLLSGVGFLVRFMVGIVGSLPANKLNGVYEKGPKESSCPEDREISQVNPSQTLTYRNGITDHQHKYIDEERCFFRPSKIVGIGAYHFAQMQR